MTPNSGDVYALAKRHANAWSAHDPEGVAELYEENALFIINLGEPMNGLISRAEMVRGYCEGVPDLKLFSDKVRLAGDGAIALWTAQGTSKETGKFIKFSGWESWKVSPNGLISRSDGWYDAEDYERQCQEGYQGS